jgi:hypothetical protein
LKSESYPGTHGFQPSSSPELDRLNTGKVSSQMIAAMRRPAASASLTEKTATLNRYVCEVCTHNYAGYLIPHVGLAFGIALWHKAARYLESTCADPGSNQRRILHFAHPSEVLVLWLIRDIVRVIARIRRIRGEVCLPGQLPLSCPAAFHPEQPAKPI